MGLYDDVEKKMKQALEHLNTELQSLRTGRANPALLNTVYADIYGSKMKLSSLATISAPEPRQLLISPFDKNNINAIAKAISSANLGLQPIADATVVRIKVPELDSSVRKELVKQAFKKNEDAKIAIRNIRREFNDLLKKQKNEGIIAEDALKKGEKKIQELTDTYCKKTDSLTKEKETDILTI